MKDFTKFVNEGQLDIADNTYGIIPVEDLKKYLAIADKFISQEAKDIINWLIVNNNSASALGLSSKTANPIESFYNNGVPTDDKLKELYKCIGMLVKRKRLLEVPVFQTKEQFDGIINKTISPDEILLDLSTERGKNRVAEQFLPLVHKIVHSRLGKTTLSYQELFSAGLEGLSWAIKDYGKKSKKDLKKEEIEGVEIDTSKKKAMTFLTFASYMIYSACREAEKNDPNIVKIPVSQQTKQKAEQGHVTRINTISGDEKRGKTKDGTDGKTVFDTIGVDPNNSAYKLDAEDLEKLWNDVKQDLIEHFDKKTIDIFCSFMGIWNYEKMKNKDIAKKYGCVPGNITAIKNKVLKYIMSTPDIKNKFTDIWELMKECLHDRDAAENDDVFVIGTNSENNMFDD